jgi:hypothetical protein
MEVMDGKVGGYHLILMQSISIFMGFFTKGGLGKRPQKHPLTKKRVFLSFLFLSFSVFWMFLGVCPILNVS